MKHIVVISSNYPSKMLPQCGTFVQEIVRAFSRRGVQCSVISPVSIVDRIRYGKLDPKISFDDVVKDKPIKVIRPRYISFSSKNCFFFNTDHLTQLSFLQAVHNALSDINPKPSLLYGHFLYPGGAAAINCARKLGIPSMLAAGESSMWSVAPVGYSKAIKNFRDVSGVISVSSMIKRSLVNKLMIPEEKIRVIPNAVDLSEFFPRNKLAMREKYGFPKNKNIIIFIGHFDERKGPHRLLSAVSSMDHVGLILIGKGPIPLQSNNILFKGVVEHSKIPEMLSVADIFVLPTLEEGSCNAIIEALACGLPVVTSKGEFNDDIVDEDVAIRVDPKNIAEIRDAIIQLFQDHDLRNRMSGNAAERAKQFDINQRAIKILDWVKESQKKYFLKRD